jgi:hypothetical protein
MAFLDAFIAAEGIRESGAAKTTAGSALAAAFPSF